VKPICLVVLVAVVVSLAACQRQPGESAPSNSGTVSFKGSGVSFIPGDAWKQVGSGDFAGAAPPGVCLPTLAGKAGLIQVLVLPVDRSDPQVAADVLRKGFDANPKSIKDSFRQESITTQSGAQVIYVSSSQQADKPGISESHNHNYIVRNRAGRVVAINHVTLTRTDSEAVQQMIRQTLKVQ